MNAGYACAATAKKKRTLMALPVGHFYLLSLHYFFNVLKN
jgi:hypothetical protein